MTFSLNSKKKNNCKDIYKMHNYNHKNSSQYYLIRFFSIGVYQ